MEKTKFKTSLYVIAIIVITWFLATFFNMTDKWWFLPSFAIITGVLAVILPFCERHFKPIISILSTGWALLLILSLKSFLTMNILALTCILFLVSIWTELYAYGVNHFGDIFFDLLICILTAWAIFTVENSVLKLLILLVCYIIVILVGFRASFSFKRDTKANKTINDNTSDNTPE